MLTEEVSGGDVRSRPQVEKAYKKPQGGFYWFEKDCYGKDWYVEGDTPPIKANIIKDDTKESIAVTTQQVRRQVWTEDPWLWWNEEEEDQF